MARRLRRRRQRSAARRSGQFNRDRRGSEVAGSAGGVVPAFAPGDLAGLALLMNLGNTATLKQDAAGTTAVAADGDPVGRALDQSVAARVYTAAGTLRPVYRATAMGGTLPCAQFDGTDDVLASAGWAITGAQTWTLDFQLTALPGSGAFYQLLTASDGTTSSAIYVSNSGVYQSVLWCLGYTGTPATIGFGGINAAGLDLGRHRLVIVANGGAFGSATTYRAWLDNVEQTLSAVGSTGALASAGTLGARADSSLPAAVRLRKIAVHSAAYPGSVTNLDSWANAA